MRLIRSSAPVRAPTSKFLIYTFYRLGSARFDPLPPGSPPAVLPITVNEQFPIPDNAPPVFTVCATDDSSHVVPTVKFYLELEARHILGTRARPEELLDIASTAGT
ncbi:MAG: hypothetical protein M3Y07_09165 [Acidobacteriota bacterium]|nr:hypothetical protein [Acidobacteriota bacterium]